jgi:hypothetical protein
MVYPPKNVGGVIIRWLARALSILIIIIFIMFLIQNLGKGNLQSKDIWTGIIELLAIAGLIYSFFEERNGGLAGFALGMVFIFVDGSFNLYYFFIPLSGLLFFATRLLSVKKEE